MVYSTSATIEYKIQRDIYLSTDDTDFFEGIYSKKSYFRIIINHGNPVNQGNRGL